MQHRTWRAGSAAPMLPCGCPMLPNPGGQEWQGCGLGSCGQGNAAGVTSKSLALAGEDDLRRVDIPGGPPISGMLRAPLQPVRYLENSRSELCWVGNFRMSPEGESWAAASPSVAGPSAAHFPSCSADGGASRRPSADLNGLSRASKPLDPGPQGCSSCCRPAVMALWGWLPAAGSDAGMGTTAGLDV